MPLCGIARGDSSHGVCFVKALATRDDVRRMRSRAARGRVQLDLQPKP
jgi:hypothetical protein